MQGLTKAAAGRASMIVLSMSVRNHAGHKAHQMPESIIFLKTVKVVSSVALTKTKRQIYLGRVQDATVRRTGPQRSSVQLVLWFCVSNCGIIYQIREMWRSEAIEQVVLFLFDIVDHYHDLGILMPNRPVLRRCMSSAWTTVMGSFWKASLLVCMVIALDDFHMVNYTNDFSSPPSRGGRG